MRTRLRRLAATAVIVVCAAGLLACQPTRLREPVYGSNVRVSGVRNFPDPSILAAGSQFYGFSSNSTGANGVNIGIIASPDLYNWVNPYTGVAATTSAGTGDALPTPPTWARTRNQGGGFWAPSAIRLGSRYVLYYAARHKSVSSTRPGWCIGYAVSSRPEGPYTASNRPLLCRLTARNGSSSSVTGTPATNQGSIDPQVYTAAGRVYLHFKALDSPTQLWGIRLQADGRRVSGAARALVSVPARSPIWEYSPRERFTVLENPAMDYNASARSSGFPYYLYYSGGDWQSSRYGTGIAACRSPLGPCGRVTTEEPWMASRRTASGPGGLSHFRVGTAHWVAYHSWEKGAPSGNGRRMHVEPLGYDGFTPVLLNRRPVGNFTAQAPIPGQVALAVRANDPDTGAPVKLVVRENGAAVAVDHVAPGVTWRRMLNVAPGSHRYCVTIGDDNGLSSRSLGCQTVSVQPTTAAAADPPPPPSASTATTAPAPELTVPTTIPVTPAPTTTSPSPQG